MLTYLELAYKAASAIDVSVDFEVTEGKLSVDFHIEIELPKEVTDTYQKLTSDDG